MEAREQALLSDANDSRLLRFAFCVMGWAAFWSWLMLATDSPLFLFEGHGSADIANTLTFSTMSSLVLARLMMAAAAHRFGDVLSGDAFLAGAALVLLTGTAMAFVPSFLHAADFVRPCVMAGGVCMGLGAAILSTGWVACYAEAEDEMVFVCVLAAFVLAILVRFAAISLPEVIHLALLLVLPPCSGVLLFACRRDVAGGSGPGCEGRGRRSGAPNGAALPRASVRVTGRQAVGLAVGILLYGTAGSIVRVLSRANNAGAVDNFVSVSSAHIAGMGTFALVAFIVSLVLLGRGRRALSPVLSRIMLSVLVLGVLIPGVFNTGLLYFANFIVGIAIGCFEILLLTYAALISKKLGVSPFHTLGIAYGSMEAASMVSFPLGFALQTSIHGGAIGWSQIGLVILAVLTLASMALFIPFEEKVLPRLLSSSDDEDGGSDGEVGRQVHEDAVREMGKCYGLTEREVEVFSLLAEGRDIPFVQKQLTISKGTAQTHTYHIYRKMGVHSKQELIDLMKEYISSKS